MNRPMRHNNYSAKTNQRLPCDVKGNLHLPPNLPQLNTTSYDSIESNTSFIDKITWPTEPLSYRTLQQQSALMLAQNHHNAIEDIEDNDSLLSSVDTNELLISPHHTQLTDMHNMQMNVLNTAPVSASRQPSIYSDEELPALPLSARSKDAKRQRNIRQKKKSASQQIRSSTAKQSQFKNSKQNTNISYMDDMSSYYNAMYLASDYNYNRNDSLQVVNDSIIEHKINHAYELQLYPPLKTDNNNINNYYTQRHPAPDIMQKRKSMPYVKKSGTSYIIRKNAQQISKTPNNISSSKQLFAKKRARRKTKDVLRDMDLPRLRAHIPHEMPQIDALDTNSQSPIPPIPAAHAHNNAKAMHLSPEHESVSRTNTNTKSSTYEYDRDYDCDVEPEPKPASFRVHDRASTEEHVEFKRVKLERIQPLTLTKENIARLNNNNSNNNAVFTMTTDSTSSEASDVLQSLENIGKQLREITIVNSSGDLSLLVQPNSNINSTPITPPLHHDVSDSSKTSKNFLKIGTNTSNTTYFKHFASQPSLASNINQISNETTARLSITVTPHTTEIESNKVNNNLSHIQQQQQQQDIEYNSDFDDNSVHLSSTDFESHRVPSKYVAHATVTESTLVTPIRDEDIAPIKFDTKYDSKYNKNQMKANTNATQTAKNRRVLSPQNERRKSNIKQNKKHSNDFNMYPNELKKMQQQLYIDDSMNGDSYGLNHVASTTPIAYEEEEKQMDYQSTIYNHTSIVVHDRNSANTTKTETYANSVDLEDALNFIHEHQKSQYPQTYKRSYDKRSQAMRENSKSLSSEKRALNHLSAKHLYGNNISRSVTSADTQPSLCISITKASNDEEEFLRTRHKQSLHVRNNKYHGTTDIIDLGEQTDSDSDDIAQPRIEPIIDHLSNDTDDDDDESEINCIQDRKVSFAVRKKHSLCLHIWMIAFHFVSIVCYLSAIYVYYIYYKFGGITYELLCCAMLTLIILLIYIAIVIKNTSSSSSVSIHRIIFGRDYRYNCAQNMINSGRKQRVFMIRCMLISCMINCTHFLLQLVISMYLYIVMKEWQIWNVFEKRELYALVTVIMIQCIGLSMTIINVIAYLWEKKHYHSQSLALRVLSIYLDIIRIAFVIYIFWSLTPDKIISSFYYLYFYVEYWLLFLLLITVRYILICFNWTALYRNLGVCRFMLYWMYSLIEAIFRFIIIQLFPHCAIYFMIHNVGTGKFDHYLTNDKHFLFCGKQMFSIKKAICGPMMLDKERNFYDGTMLRHIQLLEIFEFIENGVYEYMDNDAFLLSVDAKQEILRRILTINYQLFVDDDSWRSAALHEHENNGYLNLNNIILYEFYRMTQLAVYPLKVVQEESRKKDANEDTRHKIYDDIFQHKDISKSDIFMDWFVRNELMANLHFEWNNAFTVNHALFTTFFCKYIVTSFYIFSRITNICWLYFLINNCMLYLLNTDHVHTMMQDDTRWLLIYIFGVILILQIFAHIILFLLAVDAYNFERNIWFLLPMLNAKNIHKMLILPKYEKDERYTVEKALDVYENMCYKHIVSNHVCDIVGVIVGALIMSYVGDDVNHNI